MQTIANATRTAHDVALRGKSKRTDIDASQFPVEEIRQFHADLNATLRQSEQEDNDLATVIEHPNWVVYYVDMPERTVADLVAALERKETLMLDPFIKLRDLAREKWIEPSSQETLTDF